MRLKKNFLSLALFAASIMGATAASPVDIGSNRELFVDTYLIANLKNAALKLHHPQRREIVMSHDKPWEGNVTTYHTIFKDGDLFRMYYNGAHFTFGSWDKTRAQHQEFTCYAESRDGIHWTRPNLGLVSYLGSKANNIILANKWTHCFAPFKDNNPACKPDEKYKAIAFCHGIKGLYAFKSKDAINWSMIQNKPIVTDGKFDSQNIAFWDTYRKRYVEFHRYSDGAIRAIKTSHSQDFLNWSKVDALKYGKMRKEHLYTNAIIAYSRAPQLFMGFPMRFVDGHHRNNMIPGICDGVFMTSRDGINFHRWAEAFIRPGQNRNRWFNRCNMTAWGIIETPSHIPGGGNELSIYSSEGYSEAPEVCLRRYTLRLDGFVSVSAPMNGGLLQTKPLAFAATPDKVRRPRPEDKKYVIKRDVRSLMSGKKSLWVGSPIILEIPNTKKLGKQVTLALNTSYLSQARRTLFSAYDGQRVNGNKRILIFEMRQFPPDNKRSYLRFWYSGGVKIEIPGEKLLPIMSKGKKHHIAATWDDGIVKIYIDGKEVGSAGRKGLGDLRFNLGNLRFGEDYPPGHKLDNPFIGYADDILVLKRVLSPQDIDKLAAQGAKSVVKSDDRGVLYTMEGNNKYQLADSLTADGAQDAHTPQSESPWADTMLLLNISTSAAGSARCELQDENGKAIPGYSMKDCDLIRADEIEYPVTWNGKAELKQFAGKAVKLCFELKDADLYAIRFGQPEEKR